MAKQPHRIQIGWTGPAARPAGFADFNQSARGSPQPLFIEAREGHVITIAPTGAGKGRNVIIPTLLSYPGPVLVIDPKGEAAQVTARHRRQYGTVVLLDPYRLTTATPDSVNPFDLHTLLETGVEDCAMMLTGILRTGHASGKEVFWDNSAGGLLNGLLAYILAAEAPENQHFGTLRKLLATDDIVYSSAVKLDTQKNFMPPFAHEEIAQMLQAPDQTRGGIISTAQQHIKLFGDPAAAASVSSTSFDLKAFAEGAPMTIYLILPPHRLHSHSLLLRIWLATLLHPIMQRQTLPPIANLFLVDEAAALGALDALRTAMTLLRGYGLRCWTFWQSLSQVVQLYPEDWQVMLDNAAMVQAFGVPFHKPAQELADLTGGMAPQKILSMAPDEQLLIERGGKASIARKLDYLTDRKFQGLFDSNTRYPPRR